MKQIPKYLTKIIEKELPDMKKMVKEAQINHANTIVMMLDAFAHEPFMLHDVIWYITSHGLSVEFIPQEDKDRTIN